jgi:lipoate-protein ligase A
VRRVGGSAAGFHARDLPPETSVWHFEIARGAVVLGSRQTPALLDADACRRAGIEIAGRRSGGGIVLLTPGDTVWVDVVIAASDPRWDDDVRSSMVAMGERWAAALAGAVAGELTVHRGPMVRSEWSELLCFAGVAPGEVLLDGRKLVGLSQRRTRAAARFQCAVNRSWDVSRLLTLLAPDVRAALPASAPPEVATLGCDAGDGQVLAERLLASL